MFKFRYEVLGCSVHVERASAVAVALAVMSIGRDLTRRGDGPTVVLTPEKFAA